MRFFARLARDVVRWASRRRPSAADPPTDGRPEERAAQPVTPGDGDAHALGPPPPRLRPQGRPPLVGEAVPCIVGEPFADWLLRHSHPQTPILPDQAAIPAPAATTITFARLPSLPCGAPETTRARPRAGTATEAPVTASPASLWTVSVILVATDRPDGLRRPVGSVLGQSYPGWELLVVETGESPPPTLTHCDPRLRVVTAPGITTASGRRRGLEAASGEIIAHLDEHSLMAPHWLAQVVAILAAAPADVVVGMTLGGAGGPSSSPAGWGSMSAVAHHRHVPLAVVDQLLAPGDADLDPGISVRRVEVPAVVHPGTPDPSPLLDREARAVIDLTARPTVPFALAGR